MWVTQRSSARTPKRKRQRRRYLEFAGRRGLTSPGLARSLRPTLSMDTKRKAIGIDFGGTTIKSAVVEDGRLIQHGDVIETTEHHGAPALIEEILGVIAALRITHPEVAALGVGLPGFIDSLNGIVHELTNVPGWDEVPLRRILQERTGLPTIIENDAKAMAYGEFKYGAAKGCRFVLCITLGTGVGGALVLDGRLYRGAQLAAGELGHASIDYRGTPGLYKNPGDLEMFVGNHRIAARASQLYKVAGRNVPVEECTPYDLEKAARNGDPVAKQMWENVGLELGCALVNMIWLLNPDAIVIGGGVAKAGDLLFGPIQRTIRERTLPLFNQNLRVVPAALGNEAGIIGNATLALEAAEVRK
ncbi:ROK family protein [Chthoniobacter flavus Ellin428]|uniref:ROK family protein n=2 Tax=Chthoniobacter flavus TaxID=191863 RepID=B4D7W0_9BACT|nr:ROK family protein [Chthoniobacter flavus Ellin428]TCO92279.1 glucokinase [Chthoniobacter flavus]